MASNVYLGLLQKYPEFDEKYSYLGAADFEKIISLIVRDKFEDFLKRLEEMDLDSVQRSHELVVLRGEILKALSERLNAECEKKSLKIQKKYPKQSQNGIQANLPISTKNQRPLLNGNLNQEQVSFKENFENQISTRMEIADESFFKSKNAQTEVREKADLSQGKENLQLKTSKILASNDDSNAPNNILSTGNIETSSLNTNQNLLEKSMIDREVFSNTEELKLTDQEKDSKDQQQLIEFSDSKKKSESSDLNYFLFLKKKIGEPEIIFQVPLNFPESWKRNPHFKRIMEYSKSCVNQTPSVVGQSVRMRQVFD